MWRICVAHLSQAVDPSQLPWPAKAPRLLSLSDDDDRVDAMIIGDASTFMIGVFRSIELEGKLVDVSISTTGDVLWQPSGVVESEVEIRAGLLDTGDAMQMCKSAERVSVISPCFDVPDPSRKAYALYTRKASLADPWLKKWKSLCAAEIPAMVNYGVMHRMIHRYGSSHGNWSVMLVDNDDKVISGCTFRLVHLQDTRELVMDILLMATDGSHKRQGLASDIVDYLSRVLVASMMPGIVCACMTTQSDDGLVATSFWSRSGFTTSAHSARLATAIVDPMRAPACVHVQRVVNCVVGALANTTIASMNTPMSCALPFVQCQTGHAAWLVFDQTGKAVIARDYPGDDVHMIASLKSHTGTFSTMQMTATIAAQTLCAFTSHVTLASVLRQVSTDVPTFNFGTTLELPDEEHISDGGLYDPLQVYDNIIQDTRGHNVKVYQDKTRSGNVVAFDVMYIAYDVLSTGDRVRRLIKHGRFSDVFVANFMANWLLTQPLSYRRQAGLCKLFVETLVRPVLTAADQNKRFCMTDSGVLKVDGVHRPSMTNVIFISQPPLPGQEFMLDISVTIYGRAGEPLHFRTTDTGRRITMQNSASSFSPRYSEVVQSVRNSATVQT